MNVSTPQEDPGLATLESLDSPVPKNYDDNEQYQKAKELQIQGKDWHWQRPLLFNFPLVPASSDSSTVDLPTGGGGAQNNEEVVVAVMQGPHTINLKVNQAMTKQQKANFPSARRGLKPSLIKPYQKV